MERRRIIAPNGLSRIIGFDGNDEEGIVHELPLPRTEERGEEAGDEQVERKTPMPVEITRKQIDQVIPGRKDQERLPN